MSDGKQSGGMAAWREHRDDVLDRVRWEMNAQLRKWGQQDHDPFAYLAILVEEVGELAQAALKARFEGGAHQRMKEEALQVAAVGASLLQCLERGEWRWGSHAEEGAGGEAEAEAQRRAVIHPPLPTKPGGRPRPRPPGGPPPCGPGSFFPAPPPPGPRGRG